MSTYKRLRDRARKSEQYWFELAKIDVVIELTRLLKRREITYAKLAETLGKSPAYISKVFAGDENLTLESIVKLARALDGKLHIHIADNGCDVRWLDIFKNRRLIEKDYNRALELFTHQSKPAMVNIDVDPQLTNVEQDEYAAA